MHKHRCNSGETVADRLPIEPVFWFVTSMLPEGKHDATVLMVYLFTTFPPPKGPKADCNINKYNKNTTGKKNLY